MKNNNLPLKIVEIIVMSGILFALIFPLFSLEEESSFLNNQIYSINKLRDRQEN